MKMLMICQSIEIQSKQKSLKAIVIHPFMVYFKAPLNAKNININ